DVGLAEDLDEVPGGAGAAGRDQGDTAYLPDRVQLLEVVALTDPVRPHAVEDDLAGTELLHVPDPVQRGHGQRTGGVGAAGELPDAPDPVLVPQAVDAHDDALHAEGLGQLGDELGALGRGGVDRDLVGTGV